VVRNVDAYPGGGGGKSDLKPQSTSPVGNLLGVGLLPVGGFMKNHSPRESQGTVEEVNSPTGVCRGQESVIRTRC